MPIRLRFIILYYRKDEASIYIYMQTVYLCHCNIFSSFMKFTNEQAVEALRAELTNKGRKTQHMFDRTLAGLTEKLAEKLATEETGLPDFVSDVIEILNIVEGDARKKNSDYAKYKESHPDKEPTNDPEPHKPAENPEMKALMERIAALEKDIQDSERKSTIAQKRRDVEAKLKEKGVKDEEWMNDFLSEVNITEDFDVDAKAESYVKIYNKTKANGGKGVPPANPQGGSVNNANIKSVIAAAAALAKSNNAAGISNSND